MNLFILNILLVLASYLPFQTIFAGTMMEKTLQTQELPQYLYKVVSPEQWEESQNQKYLSVSAMDQKFIHLAMDSQLARVTSKFWANQPYLILKLDPSKIEGNLIFEENPGGSNKYYHVYDGGIPLEAVVESESIN